MRRPAAPPSRPRPAAGPTAPDGRRPPDAAGPGRRRSAGQVLAGGGPGPAGRVVLGGARRASRVLQRRRRVADRHRRRAVGRADAPPRRPRRADAPGLDPAAGGRELAAVMRRAAAPIRRPGPTPSGGWPWPRSGQLRPARRRASRPIPTCTRRCAPRAAPCWRRRSRRGRLRARLWPASLVAAARRASRPGRRVRRPRRCARRRQAPRRSDGEPLGRAPDARQPPSGADDGCREVGRWSATGRSGGGSAPRGGSSAAAGRRAPRGRTDPGRPGRGRRPGWSRPRRRRWRPCS